MIPDAELLAAYAANGDEGAFATLVGRHLNLVYFAALRRTGGNAPLAEEIAQSVFAEAARKAGLLARHATVIGWLYTTTRNVATDTMRRERTRLSHEREIQRMHELMATDPAADWDRLRPVIDGALDELPARDREAVLLRFFGGQTYAAMGATRGISEDAARMRVERALERLRALLRKRGVTSTGTALAAALAGQAAFAAPPALAATIASGAVTAAAASAMPPTLFAFMGNAKMATAAMAAFAMTAVGIAIWQSVVRREVEAELAAATRRYQRVSAEANFAARKAGEAERRLAARESARSDRGGKSQGQAGSSSLTVAEPAHVEREPRRFGTEIMARHPGVKSALIAWHVAKVNFQFAPLYAELGLNPPQIARFQELVRGTILFGDWGAKGEYVEFEAPRSVPDEQVRGQLQDLLGEAGFRSYEKLLGSIREREWTVQVASQLCLTDTPLAPAQAAELIAILKSTPSRETMLERAATTLAPAQLAALRGILEADQKWIESEQLKRDVAAARMGKEK
jgi:RNA polymerase sigma factor (sigma-70 family)